jgi:hypothetical protein
MKKYLFFLFILSIYFIACDKNENVNLFTKDDFSIKVGNWWKYQLNDYVSNKTDTIIIKITSLEVKDGENTYNCIYSILDKIVDSSYIKFSNNEILFNGTADNYYFGNIKTTLPFKPGDVSIYLRDSIKVISYNPGYKLLDKYYDAYTIERHAYGIDDGFIQTTLISKNIGIVKNTYLMFGRFPRVNKTFVLIDYKIN